MSSVIAMMSSVIVMMSSEVAVMSALGGCCSGSRLLVELLIDNRFIRVIEGIT